MNSQTALRKSHLYGYLIKCLHQANFHLYSTEVLRNTIRVTVVVDKNRREENVQFDLPIHARSFDVLKYQEGIRSDIHMMIESGARPPRSQFENVADLPVPVSPRAQKVPVVALPPKEPEPDEVKIVEEVEAPKESVIEDMMVVLRCSKENLPRLLEQVMKSGSLVKVVPVEDREPESEPQEQPSQKKQETKRSGESWTKKIIVSLREKPMTASELVRNVGYKYAGHIAYQLRKKGTVMTVVVDGKNKFCVREG